jgi:hypothetical protein
LYEKPINNATVRSLTGGNAISGHGKQEKTMNINTDFLVRMTVNKFLDYAAPLGSMDRRRLTIVYYPDMFKPADDPTYDSTNPPHHLQVNYKSRMNDFAAEYVEWCRALAPATKAGDVKFIWPHPSSMLELIETLIPETDGSVEDLALKFAQEKPTRLVPDDVPSSRDAITKAFSVRLGGDGVSSKGKAFQNAQVALRNILVASDRYWGKRDVGDRGQVRVYRFDDDNQDPIMATGGTAVKSGEGAQGATSL